MIKIIFLFAQIILYSKSNKTINDNNNYNETKNEYLNHSSFKFMKHLYNKNVIIGIIQKYPLKVVQPFFNSFVHANFTNCDLVIFVKGVSKVLINYLKNIGVTIYKITKNYKIPVTSFRWKYYSDFLKKNKNKYNLVFICDIRDTFFQKDIFKYYDNHKPFIGLAVEDGTLNNRINRKWIIDYVGEEKYKAIQNEKIICFGTFWGTLEYILKFSNILWDKLKYINNSSDQGVGNYLFYYEKIFEGFLLKSDNFGPVMTIGLTERKNLTLDSEDNVLNFKGEIAAVVHQYDRKKDIMNKIRNKYLFLNTTITKNVNKSKKKI